jgi:predicted nucleic-acid-binding protein
VIGVDTNIILRLFDLEDASRTRIAERLIAREAKADGCLVNPIVLAEFAWTLDRSYKLDRGEVADHLERILRAPEFRVPFADEATTAVSRFRSGPADFADYFLAEISRSLGCTTTATFDHEAGKAAGFTLLTA